jgi:hypothetical protein
MVLLSPPQINPRTIPQFETHPFHSESFLIHHSQIGLPFDVMWSGYLRRREVMLLLYTPHSVTLHSVCFVWISQRGARGQCVSITDARDPSTLIASLRFSHSSLQRSLGTTVFNVTWKQFCISVCCFIIHLSGIQPVTQYSPTQRLPESIKFMTENEWELPIITLRFWSFQPQVRLNPIQKRSSYILVIPVSVHFCSPLFGSEVFLSFSFLNTFLIECV